MPALPALNDEMFLNENILSYINHVHQTHSNCFLFVKKLNALAHKALIKIPAPRGGVLRQNSNFQIGERPKGRGIYPQ